MGTPRTTAVKAALLAALGYLLGLLPWLVHGGRLPVSGAWPAYEVGATPWVALPFSEYQIANLLALTALAGALAVALPHGVLRGPSRPPLWPVVGVALLQASSVVGRGLAGSEAADLLVLVLTLAAGLGGLVGTGLGLLLVRGRPVVRALSGAVLAWLVPSWLSMLLAYGASAPSPLQVTTVGLVPFVAAVLHGLALARLGLGGVGRALTWLVSLGIAVLLPALMTAAFYAGSYAHPGQLRGDGMAELVDATLDVTAMAVQVNLSRPGPLLLAVVVGLAGTALRSRKTEQLRERPLPSQDA
jgi:hypothetical protein